MGFRVLGPCDSGIVGISEDQYNPYFPLKSLLQGGGGPPKAYSLNPQAHDLGSVPQLRDIGLSGFRRYALDPRL